MKKEWTASTQQSELQVRCLILGLELQRTHGHCYALALLEEIGMNGTAVKRLLALAEEGGARPNAVTPKPAFQQRRG